MRTIVDCQTCLYMATHEKCDGCLRTEEDYKAMKFDGSPDPPFRYLYYKEGNWMDRVIQAEIDGDRNIVIGGQGEAEVNTKWTPQETSTHLHYVSEQCGYSTGSLTNDGMIRSLRIATTEGQYRLVWSVDGRLLRIEPIGKVMFDWKWENKNPFRQAS